MFQIMIISYISLLNYLAIRSSPNNLNIWGPRSCWFQIESRPFIALVFVTSFLKR